MSLTIIPAEPGIRSCLAGSNVYIADVGPGYYQSEYLFQKISDLNVGATYDVSFWQAGANFTDASGTVAQWLVSLSGAPQYSIEPGSGSNAVTWWLPAVSEVNGAVVTNLNAVNTNNALAPAMDVSKGPVGWEYVTVALKATAATEYLSFVGAGSGAPPWALLTDVSMVDPPAAPEPSTWAMMGLGFAGLVCSAGVEAGAGARPQPDADSAETIGAALVTGADFGMVL